MKVMTFRYPDKLDEDIKIIDGVGAYSGSKTLNIVKAIKISAAYIKKIQGMKTIKDEYAVKEKIEGSLNIKIPWMNSLSEY